MSTSASTSLSGITCPPAWATIRFRRAKDSQGWALLGIPPEIYPAIAVRLFELQARLISRYDDGPFTSLLFEAPPPVAAKLACVFPAPPGCEALRISETGDRILSGRTAQSAKGIYQQPDPSTDELSAA
ncbi:MAG TPA: hypothetical protein V6D29_10485 [Leptolyngbyaceae cyanobacterium]